MAVTSKYLLWDHGVIGGWTAAVEIDGVRFKVPAKIVGDGHGAGMVVSFDNREEAKRAACRFWRVKMAQLGHKVAA